MHAERITPYLEHVYYLGKMNGGTATALNHGIQMSSGQYVAWLSSDDLFYPNKIANQLHFMLEQNARISYTSFNSINADSAVTQLDVTPRYSNEIDFYRTFLHANPINGCTVMMRRDLFERIGIFNESLPYTHDLDLWYRVLLNGIKIHFLGQSLVAYRWHEEMGTKKHAEAIQHEVAYTMGKYKPSLEWLISQMAFV
jgi:GT2 family glycosyltransferase